MAESGAPASTPDPSQATQASSTSGGLRVLVDTNVVLDLLLRRQPWFAQAQPMWDARDAGTIVICVPTSALTNIYYVGRKQIGQQQVMAGIRFCVTNFELVPLGRRVAEYALTLPGADYEDNLQIACAFYTGVRFLVTRDRSGFTGAPARMRVVDPPTLMASLAPPGS